MPEREKRDIHLEEIFYRVFFCIAIRFQEIPIEKWTFTKAEFVIFNFVPDIKTWVSILGGSLGTMYMLV